MLKYIMQMLRLLLVLVVAGAVVVGVNFLVWAENLLGPLIMMVGSNDSVVDHADLAKANARLPASTQRVVIEGGNHAQFGWYGAQPGDSAVTISRETQQQQVVTATLGLLRQIAGR